MRDQGLRIGFSRTIQKRGNCRQQLRLGQSPRFYHCASQELADAAGVGLAERKGDYHLHRRGSYLQLCLRYGRTNEYCRRRVMPSAFPAARRSRIRIVLMSIKQFCNSSGFSPESKITNRAYRATGPRAILATPPFRNTSRGSRHQL
jgi:hypothetical protein